MVSALGVAEVLDWSKVAATIARQRHGSLSCATGMDFSRNLRGRWTKSDAFFWTRPICQRLGYTRLPQLVLDMNTSRPCQHLFRCTKRCVHPYCSSCEVEQMREAKMKFLVSPESIGLGGDAATEACTLDPGSLYLGGSARKRLAEYFATRKRKGS